jgi:hypothetical protein
MKFDEWGLRKNNSSKGRPVRKTVSRAASTIHPGNSDEPVGKQHPRSDASVETGSLLEAHHPGSVAPPAAPNVQAGPTATNAQSPEIPLEPEEVFALADEGHAFMKLRTMLLELRPGVGGVKTVLPWLQEHWPTDIGDVAILFILVSVSAVFKRGPADEKSLLVKACLEADLKAEQQRDSTCNEYSPDGIWLVDWWKACVVLDWDVAKLHLFRFRSPCGEDFNRIFVDCALVVTAERLLRYLMEWLEGRRARVEPLSSHESEEARQFRDVYITILDDFREKELDVDISWYKYALQIAAWNEAVATVIQEEQKQRLEQLEKDSQKYHQLKSMFKTVEAGVSNGKDVVACNVPVSQAGLIPLNVDLPLTSTVVEITHNIDNATQKFSHG